MKRGRGTVIALLLAILVGGTAAVTVSGQGLVESTSAAWSDRTHAAAAVTAGKWSTTTANTCTAYGYDGRALSGCAVTSITYDGWGTPGAQTRNYYVNFQTPSGARSVTFDVDLSTATDKGGSWSWKSAKVVSGAQFTARDGWTCAQLPRVRGTGADWQVAAIYFQVAESGGAPTACS